MIKSNKRKDFLAVRVLAKAFARPCPIPFYKAVPGRSPQAYLGASAGRGPNRQAYAGSQVPRKYS